MKTMTSVAAWTVLLACMGSTVAAQDTKVGFAVGAAVPAGGIALNEPTLSVSGWLARPIRGPYGWRAEVGRVHLQMPEETKLRCAAAGIFCDADVYVSSVGGGLQFEPLAEEPIAPYGYVTIGLYHSTASAEVADTREGSAQLSPSWSDNAIGIGLGSGLRIRLADRCALRIELRYSGFGWKPGTVNWASVVTPGVAMSVAF
jgi:hypothetical protein